MVHTILDTNTGEISFQDYFVRRKCEPVVKNIIFKSKKPVATDAVNRALKAQDLNGLVICPSNPYLSIDPILSIPRIKKLIQNLKKPRIAISPIVDGDSIKGPTSKIMQEMGIEVSCSSIAKHYQGLIDGIIIDQSDEAQVNNIEKMGIQVKLANIIVKTKTEKNKLAQESLEFLDEISKS